MDIEQLMKDQGYSEGHDHPIYRSERTFWYKRIEGKHQIEVVRHNGISNFASCFDLSMTFETLGGYWANVMFYGLDLVKLENHIQMLEARLVAGMQKMCANPKHYQYDGED